jgi:hypothetical protein
LVKRTASCDSLTTSWVKVLRFMPENFQAKREPSPAAPEELLSQETTSINAI